MELCLTKDLSTKCELQGVPVCCTKGWPPPLELAKTSAKFRRNPCPGASELTKLELQRANPLALVKNLSNIALLQELERLVKLPLLYSGDVFLLGDRAKVLRCDFFWV